MLLQCKPIKCTHFVIIIVMMMMMMVVVMMMMMMMSGKFIPLQNEIDVLSIGSPSLGCPHTHLDIAV